MDTANRILFLLDNYTGNTASGKEIDELFAYLNTGKYDEIFEKHIDAALQSKTTDGADLPAYKSEMIVRKILSANSENIAIIRKISWKQKIRKISAAAAVLALLIAIGTGLFFKYKKSRTLTADIPGVEISSLKSYYNTTLKAVQVTLEEGSVITLQPGAKLYYPPYFEASIRQVKLEGDAFFDISKNPHRPFLIYHENLVTRVLGTSFYIRHDREQGKVEVEVRTGKVEVYENIKSNEAAVKNNGVIITPNQKMTYAESNRIFSTSLVDAPVPIIKDSVQAGKMRAGYNLERVSVADIITRMQADYGISIELENENIGKCLFTGDIGMQNLFTKLDILTTAIGAQYELKGTVILLKGEGCKN